MRFLTGDDTGILKVVRVEAQKVERFGPQRRGDAAERLCWAGPVEQPESRVAVAYASGAIELRDGAGGQVLGAIELAPGIKSLQALGSDRLFAASESGATCIVAGWRGESLRAPAADDAQDDSGAKVERFTLTAPLADARPDPLAPHRIAFGGLENDVKVFDLEKGEVTWRARNVKENSLCLRVPVRISQVQWATRLAPSRSLVMCATTDAKVRLYDVGAQRRPLFEMKIGYKTGQGSGGHTGTTDDVDRPILCSAVAQVRQSEWSLFVGNTTGTLREYDLRKLPACQTAQTPPGRKAHLSWAEREMPLRRGYKGVMGSIRAMDVHQSGDVLVAVGLGRFAYVFETRRRAMLSKVFLKQKLCSVLLSSEERKGAKAGAKEDDEAEEEEEEEGAQGQDGEEPNAENDENDEVEEGFSDDGEGGTAEAPEDGGEAVTKAAKRKKRRKSSGAKAGVRRLARKKTD